MLCFHSFVQDYKSGPSGLWRAVVPVDNNMYANKIQLPTLRALPSIKHIGRIFWYFHIFLVGGKIFVYFAEGKFHWIMNVHCKCTRTFLLLLYKSQVFSDAPKITRHFLILQTHIVMFREEINGFHHIESRSW